MPNVHRHTLKVAVIELDEHRRDLSRGAGVNSNEAIGEIASTPQDGGHPLWEMYYVEGLANGRVAVVCKIHHALADGVASGNLMARAMGHWSPRSTPSAR
jgi:diacylglycerol O-acyltransferase / wax synthase